mmetsp:Transcript_21538/g.64597  ORF Transcript_21538/g.64597 Transcript_21538/m.64597 type:complete len:212 (-) Transcript_21538:270-905(-)
MCRGFPTDAGAGFGLLQWHGEGLWYTGNGARGGHTCVGGMPLRHRGRVRVCARMFGRTGKLRESSNWAGASLVGAATLAAPSPPGHPRLLPSGGAPAGYDSNMCSYTSIGTSLSTCAPCVGFVIVGTVWRCAASWLSHQSARTASVSRTIGMCCRVCRRALTRPLLSQPHRTSISVSHPPPDANRCWWQRAWHMTGRNFFTPMPPDFVFDA